MSSLRELFFNTLYAINFQKFLRAKNKITVLCLHRVNHEVDLIWPALKPEIFEKILLYLSKQYTVIGLNDLNESLITKKAAKPYAILSFDDGYLDFKEVALPLLLKYNMKANMNIVVNSAENGSLIWTQRLNSILNQFNTQNTGLLSEFLKECALDPEENRSIHKAKIKIQNYLYKRSYDQIDTVLTKYESLLSITYDKKIMMDWDDIRFCFSKGIEIGSHTMTHRPLELMTDPGSMDYELDSSKKRIEEKLQTKIDTIAFPNGLYNELAVEKAKKAGYKNLLLVGEEKYFFQPSEVKKIKRISIYHNHFQESIFKMEGFHKRVGRLLN